MNGPVVPLGAGGTLQSRPLTPAACAWRSVEMALIFGAAPLLLIEVIHGRFPGGVVPGFQAGQRTGLFTVLIPLLGVIIAVLLADRSFSLRREFNRCFGWRTLAGILAVFATAGGAVAFAMSTYYPALFLEFPLRRPDVYARVLVLYPLMSVLVQELVFRTFFFHRYGPLFGRHVWPAIVLNGTLFGYAHIVMGNAFAVWSTALIGCLLAYRYAQTRSLWAVWLEHGLWGGLVFTVGLGRWFFTGVGN